MMKKFLPLLILLFPFFGEDAEAACTVESEVVDTGTGYRILTGTCDADNDILIQTVSSLEYDACLVGSTTGSVDVDVSLDGTNYFAAISLKNEHDTDGAEAVATTVDKVYSFVAKFRAIRVRAVSAAATATLLCWDYE